MRYIVFVSLPGLYVRAWEELDSSRSDRPLAVHRDRTVLDLNGAARERGLRHGMGLAEAKVLLRGEGLIPFEEAPYREAARRWLGVLAEFSSRVEPVSPHEAWADFGGHPQPWEMALDLRRKLVRTTGLAAEVGAGSSKWIARLAAELGGDAPDEEWEALMRGAADAPQELIAPLPIAFLAPADPAHRERLKELGYRTIGEAAKVPLRLLQVQFGRPEAQRIRQASRGRLQEPVRALYPPDAVAAGLEVAEGIGSEESLWEAYGTLAQACARRLSDRSAVGHRLELTVGYERASKSWERTFSRALRTATQIESALRRMLPSLPEDAYRLTVRMPNLVATAEKQTAFRMHDAPQAGGSAERAIEGLRQTFGDRTIVRASQIEEPRRVKVLRAWSHATGWK
jgi:DNA polymerase IV